MSEKTSEKVKFKWAPPMQDSFDTLKQALTTTLVLVYQDFSRPLLIALDTSTEAFGAVSSQSDENERECPIHYAKRTLKEAETNYSLYERERLAIVIA